MIYINRIDPKTTSDKNLVRMIDKFRQKHSHKILSLREKEFIRIIYLDKTQLPLTDSEIKKRKLETEILYKNLTIKKI